jgi:hypothetical protein
MFGNPAQGAQLPVPGLCQGRCHPVLKLDAYGTQYLWSTLITNEVTKLGAARDCPPIEGFGWQCTTSRLGSRSDKRPRTDRIDALR